MSTTTNGRTLTTREATVTTAAVEIKTLTVRGKQVTQAMFRQLVEEDVVDDDGYFAGLPQRNSTESSAAAGFSALISSSDFVGYWFSMPREAVGAYSYRQGGRRR